MSSADDSFVSMACFYRPMISSDTPMDRERCSGYTVKRCSAYRPSMSPAASNSVSAAWRGARPLVLGVRSAGCQSTPALPLGEMVRFISTASTIRSGTATGCRSIGSKPPTSRRTPGAGGILTSPLRFPRHRAQVPAPLVSIWAARRPPPAPMAKRWMGAGTGTRSASWQWLNAPGRNSAHGRFTRRSPTGARMRCISSAVIWSIRTRLFSLATSMPEPLPGPDLVSRVWTRAGVC